MVKDIRRKTRRHFSAEDKICVVLDDVRGDNSIAELCRRDGIAQSLYYAYSKEFRKAGKRRLAGDTARAATTDELKDLCREARDLKECVADLMPRRLDGPFEPVNLPLHDRRHYEIGALVSVRFPARLPFDRHRPRRISLSRAEAPQKSVAEAGEVARRALTGVFGAAVSVRCR